MIRQNEKHSPHNRLKHMTASGKKLEDNTWGLSTWGEEGYNY